mmetsp:Transcript_4029/g.7331  ORF Transcript_4029/g.7331 Transcript_4029/m.7331 type:complete len:170 (-) Transcript_4029:164-673(-)
MAFEFLDADKSGKISLANLKKRIGVFFPNMTAKEYRFLMNGRKDITLNDLTELLVDNEVTNFDPVAEAFKAYDPLGEGKIDPQKLRDVFENFGGGPLSAAELDVVTRAADLDNDGVISQDDFRYMLDMHRVKEIPVAPPDPLGDLLKQDPSTKELKDTKGDAKETEKDK